MENKTIKLIITTIVFGILFGSIIYNIIKPKRINQSEINQEYKTIKQTDAQEPRVSVNTKIILNTSYQNCGHEIEEILDNKEYINMGYEELNVKLQEKNKSDEIWAIELFEDNIIVISRNIYQMCKKHFVVTQKDEKVIVYYEQYDDKKKLKNEKIFRETDIFIEYLTKLDRQTLEEGIVVEGEKEVNRILENYK